MCQEKAVERQDQSSAPLQDDGSPYSLERHVAKMMLEVVCAHRWSRTTTIPAALASIPVLTFGKQDCRLMYARFLRRRIVPEMRVDADSTGSMEQRQRSNLAYIGDSMRDCAPGASNNPDPFSSFKPRRDRGLEESALPWTLVYISLLTLHLLPRYIEPQIADKGRLGSRLSRHD